MTTREQIIAAAKLCGYWNGQTIEMNDVGLERFYAIAFAAGAASRDAEVAELKKDALDFHGQVNRLTEWNNNLVSHRDELLAEIAELVAALQSARAMIGHPDNIAIIDAALAKVRKQ